MPRKFLNVNTYFKLRNLLRNFPFQKQEIEELQLKKLKKLLIYSYRNFPFYKDIFDKVKLDPYQIKHINDLKKLPIIDKEKYRDFCYSIVAKNPGVYEKYYKDGTSGSTGKPLKIYRTWDERAYMLAKYLRTLFLNGYKITDRTFCLPSPHRLADKDSILQKFGIMKRFSVSYTAEIEEMVDGYIASKADFLYGNKSQLVQMASFILENKIEIKQPRFYLCAGEVLDINSKKLIESVFGHGNMFEVYGGVEFNNLAFQIIGKDYFHFCHDTDILELEENDSTNTKRGNCIITDLHIYSFPLIRYRLGDLIETEEKEGLQIIKKIQGRLDDWVVLKDGSRLPFHHFYEIMEKRAEVRQFRFIQETGDLLKVLIVLDKGCKKSGFRANIIKELKEEISQKMDYEIIFRDKIPPDESGKLRMVISKMSK